MVCIVQCIEQVFVEWVNVLQPRKAVEDGLKLFAERFGRELDLSRVEVCRLSAGFCSAHTGDVLRIRLILKPERI